MMISMIIMIIRNESSNLTKQKKIDKLKRIIGYKLYKNDISK